MVMCAKSFHKKSIIVIAGVDAAKDKEINYGIWLSPWKSVLLRYAFRKADRLLVVDPSLKSDAMRLADYDGGNIINVPFGFDGHRWKPGETKEEVVLTVAACENKWRMKKKGIDLLFGVARAMPQVHFRVIGMYSSFLQEIRSEIPPNVEVIPRVPRDKLLPYYQNAKVYCQPSYTEGLPNTLCEAMLCGCIPVGTTAGGIPTAIGPTGYLVKYGDKAALVNAIRDALAAPLSRGMEARQRILSEFTLEKRESSLKSIIDELSR
jgi:glycosyltransferase involved in cell wall biosynthesis